jgi:hypothetical protein
VAAGPIVVTAGRVVLRGLLFPFAVLAGYFVAWGMVFCMDAIVRAFFGTVTGAVGWIPFAGRVISSPLHAIEKKLTSFLGGLEAHFEHQMATRWHTLAQLVRQYAADTVATATAIATLAHKIAYVYGEAASGKLGARFQKWVLGELSKLHGITKLVVRTTKVIEHSDVGPIAAGAASRVKPVARALEHVIELDLPRLRSRDRYLTDQVGRLWRWTRTHGREAASGVALGALVFALGRLGIGWARCSNVRKLGRGACGMNPDLLDSLLAGALVVASPISVVELAKAAQTFTAEAEAGLRWFVRELQ